MFMDFFKIVYLLTILENKIILLKTMTIAAVRKYRPLFVSLKLLSLEQISSLFKTALSEFVELFIEVAFNVCIHGTVPLSKSEKTNFKKFSKDCLKITDSRFTVKQKQRIFVKTPKLAVALANCLAKYLESNEK